MNSLSYISLHVKQEEERFIAMHHHNKALTLSVTSSREKTSCQKPFNHIFIVLFMVGSLSRNQRQEKKSYKLTRDQDSVYNIRNRPVIKPTYRLFYWVTIEEEQVQRRKSYVTMIYPQGIHTLWSQLCCSLDMSLQYITINKYKYS